MVGGTSISATWDGDSTGGVNTEQFSYGRGPLSILASGNAGICANLSGACNSVIGR